jgi:hypothetical protein
VFFGDCMEWPGDFDAGIVEGHIETAMGGHDKLERLLDIGILGDVCANKGGGAAVLGDRRGDVRAFLFATAGKDDFGARFGKGQRRSFADTGGSSGNENDFVSIRVLHSRYELIG